MIISCILFFLNPSFAALDNYSKLDEIEDWIIERKLDSKTKEIFCRASLVKNGNWFSSRIRLDKNDELVFPDGLNSKLKIKEKTLSKIIYKLSLCRKDYLYID